LYRFLAITVLLDVKDIPQVGPLQWGWIRLIGKEERAMLPRIDLLAERLLMILFAAAFLAPNLLLYSIDDIAFLFEGDPLRVIAVNQAVIGRYSFAFLCWMLDAIAFDLMTLKATGYCLLSVGLVFFYDSLIALCRTQIDRGTYLLGLPFSSHLDWRWIFISSYMVGLHMASRLLCSG
jgi:hypothetical protein